MGTKKIELVLEAQDMPMQLLATSDAKGELLRTPTANGWLVQAWSKHSGTGPSLAQVDDPGWYWLTTQAQRRMTLQHIALDTGLTPTEIVIDLCLAADIMGMAERAKRMGADLLLPLTDKGEGHE